MFAVDREKLRELRRSKKFTLEEAGRAVGGPKKTANFLWSLETGKTKHLRAIDLFSLAHLFDVDPRELVKKEVGGRHEGIER